MAKLHTSLFIPKSRKDLIKTIFEWESPERIWTPKNRGWYIWYSLFFTLLIAANVIWEWHMFTLALLAFIFLWFLQASLPPKGVTHKITSLGVKTQDNLFVWKDIKCFWISQKGLVKVLHLEVANVLKNDPKRIRRVSILLNNDDEYKIFDLLIQKLSYGTKKEVSADIISDSLYGKYVALTRFLPDESPILEEETE